MERLADHPQALDTLKLWFQQEWAPYYGPAGPGNARQDLEDCCNLNELPIGLQAIREQRGCGTAALKLESVTTHRHMQPWLAALLVDPQSRGSGVARRLIAAVEDLALVLGYPFVYVGTGTGSGTPENALLERGWERVDSGP